MYSPQAPRRTPQAAPPGFTLIELLVVVMIMLVLAAVTVSAINISIDGDKVRAGARQVQSYLEGARSRAVAAREPRGVRFLLDPTDPRTVTSMIYIAASEPWTEGTIWLERPDLDNDGTPAFSDPDDPMHPNNAPHQSPPLPIINDADDVYVLRGFDYSKDQILSAFGFSQAFPLKVTNWLELYQRGLIRNGDLVTLDPGGRSYAIDTRLLEQADPRDGDPPVRLLLHTPYVKRAERPVSATNTPPPPAVPAFNAPYRGAYSLKLVPAPLPNQEPVQLPKGVVIHLDRCSSDPDDPSKRGDKLPSTWKFQPPGNSTSFVYTPYCDILFSPRGVVVGPEASSGIIHLYIGEQKDADRDRADWAAGGSSAPEYGSGQTASDPTGPAYQRGDKLVVSIFTRTGAISVNPIHPLADSQPNQRFRYSETGEVAGK
uniref:Prepilin-type N-terminal cleavage/methylation domain-containing protein n=1 Tax=Schlesneria paludicola TaxID=360056 RepID=A0A7C4QQX4_9PLAN